ncbi:MAG: solute carrier family 26 protein [Balneolaceae bacterium]
MKKIIESIPVRLPLLKTLRYYTRDDFRNDLNAGLTVTVMLVPQGMAYAVLAGLPPVYGLYASIVPLLVYALFGTSRQLAVGPVAMVALLILTGVGEFAEPGSSRFIQLAITAALGVGIAQLLMGVFRMGFLVNFLSHPVLSGFTSAAAIIIGASQISSLLGIDSAGGSHVHTVLLNLVEHFGDVDPITTLIGFGSVAVIYTFKKWKPSVPSALLVVAGGTLFTALFQLQERGVAIVGEVPKGLPGIVTGAFSVSDLELLLPMILVISLVGYMESIAVAKAIANKRGYNIDPNQELIALGSANIAGSLFQSFPVTGGFSRTAVNDQAGAISTLASVITALLIGVTVLFLTPLFYYLPKAVLAAIIVVAVAGLFDFREARHLWKSDRRDLLMLLATFVSTLLFGIEEGILTGVVLSLVLVIYSSSRPHQAELGRLGKTRNFRNIERYNEAKTDPAILIYRFDSSLFFANIEHFRETIHRRVRSRGKELKLVILDASAIHEIDSSGIQALQKLVDELREHRIDLYLAGVIGPVRDRLKLSGALQKIGKENFFFDVAEAVDFLDQQGKGSENRTFSPYQSNW